MRILAFGDVHGSPATARLMLRLVEKHRPETVVLLGDMLFQSPSNPVPTDYDPQGTADILSGLSVRVVAVEGNCNPEAEKSLLPFPPVGESTWIETHAVRIFVTHGHIHGPGNLPALSEGDVFLYGHTHVPRAQVVNGIILCNPGSLTIPADDHPAAYGMFESCAFTVLTAEDDEPYLRLEGF